MDDFKYLAATLAIAKTQRNGYRFKKSNADINYTSVNTGAILVQAKRILAIGYDNEETGELAELMALAQVGYHAPGAILYTSMAPSRHAFCGQVPLLVNSKISCLVYGYCELSHVRADMSFVAYQNILQQLEEAGIRLIYLRIPELLSFYAPFRFSSTEFNRR